MPLKSISRNIRRSRRPFRRVRRTTRSTAMVAFNRPKRRGYFPIRNLAPNMKVVKLRYSLNNGDEHTLTSTTGSLAHFVYRANGMYDPYAGAGGNQPRGFDQYMALYRHFTVVYSKIFLEFYHASESTSFPCKVGIYLRDTTTSLSTSQDIGEYPRIRQATLTEEASKIRISMGFNAKKFFQIRDPLDEDDLKGTSGADPTQQADFHIFGYALNSQSETPKFNGYIDYIAVLTHPILPTQS